MTIEKKKFDALIAKAEHLFYNAVYINSTPLGIFAWNLSLQEIKWHKHWMPASTDFGKSEQIEKIVGFLPISKAIKLTGALDY